MAAILEIGGKDYEAKCTFKFDRVADAKYNQKDKDGNETGGFSAIYTGLLQYSTKSLLQFWDCGLAYLGKNGPKLEEIEEALDAKIEEFGDIEPLFKEAFQTIDNSGFFKLQVKSFWKNIDLFEKTGKTEEEKEQNKKGVEMMKEARNELTA